MRVYRLFNVFLFLLITITTASAHNFMPDNDLWKDDIYYINLKAAVDSSMFNKIMQGARDSYSNQKLTINGDWSDPTVNASCNVNSDGNIFINMYGGLARRPEVTLEGFTIVLCHELGHAFAGSPYLNSDTHVSAEGQADYYSTLTCYSKIASKVTELSKIVNSSDFIKAKCSRYNDNQINYANCVAKLEGGLSIGRLLSTLDNETAPQYETPDTIVVSETELSYPATTQCRIDTYLAGTLAISRPACWFRQ
ncbi:MAG: hypothetical protein HQK49_03335 [Oligoflexia bacterium]|nr:hypothetical protein [Oligoflexia bacterium]